MTEHRTNKPKVGGSSPPRRVTQAPENTTVTETDTPSTEPEKQNLALSLFLESEINPDLRLLVQSWPELPEHIKAAIKALVQTNKTEVK